MGTSKQGRVAAASEEGQTLSPRVERELAASALLAAIDRYIRVAIRAPSQAEEWVDQHTSPLGKRAHLEAVRSGKLRGVKHGRRILVRRAELNSFLESHSVKHRGVTDDSPEGIDRMKASEVAAAVLTHVGLRQRKG
jgi:hypothetical protein